MGRKMFYPERYRRALKKAVEILRKHFPSNEIEAYDILRKMEAELDMPVNWDLVVEAYKSLSRKKEV
ncbi:MAG: hypothetical protein J7K21_07520 [Desulfurococcales archaeon]|nr:hypothetical protein [Desulfurococcales archaeon]